MSRVTSVCLSKKGTNDMDELFASLFLSLILTIVAYMAFPLIRLLINHGRFEKKRAKKIALWNSSVVGAFFCILTVSGDSGSTWNAAPAFLYYWINCAILTDKNAPSEPKQKANEENTSSYQTVTRPPQISNIGETPKTYGTYNISGSDVALKQEPIAEQPKIQFCRKCGNKLADASIFCNKCGTKIIADIREEK